MTETLIQTNTFNASVEKLYATIATTDSHSAMTGAPANLPTEAGGAFTTHGGAIEGWTLELATNKHIVQAWRPTDWPAGVYSIVRYDFADNEGRTDLTLTHSSIPEGGSKALESGWQQMYWTPLAKHLEG